MGCQCSQAASVSPQQPHPLDSELTPSHQTPHSPEPKAIEHRIQIPLQQVSLPQSSCDKENQPARKGSKVQGEKRPTSQTDLKVMLQKRKSEVPILDSTNFLKTNEAAKHKDTKEKPLTSRSECKVEDQPSLGPSSKSIELAEQIKEQCKQQKKVEINRKDFELEHWQKGEGEKLGITERLKIVDQMQVERQEVGRYLAEVWNYEKEVLNDIPGYLELPLHKKQEQPLLAGQ